MVKKLLGKTTFLRLWQPKPITITIGNDAFNIIELFFGL